MTRLSLLTAGVAFLLWDASLADERYPNARRQHVTETIHGIEINDPYRWFEESKTEELGGWVASQNALTRQFVSSDEYEKSRLRIRELATYPLSFGGRQRRERLFYLRRPPDSNTVELRVRNGGDSLLLRPDQIPDADFERSFIGGRNFVAAQWPNRSGRLLAYGYTDGADRTRIRVLDASTRQHLPDVIDEGSLSSGVEWDVTGNGFYYFRMRLRRQPGASDWRREPFGLWYHRLGTSQEEDEAIISPEAGDRRVLTPVVTADGSYLVVASRRGTATETSFFVFETESDAADPRVLFGDSSARFVFLGSRGSRLFFQTTLNAPNGRVIAVDLAESDSINELVPESDSPMLSGSNVGGDVLGYFGNRFVLGYLRDGQPDIRIFDKDGRLTSRLELPSGSTIWGILDNEPGESRVTVSLLSPFAPGRIISFDAKDGSARDEVTADVPVDAEAFIVERVFYTSRDGTRVPMSVVYRRDLKRDGGNPTLVYGYGMHKWVSLLFYQPHIVRWLELGGIYAVPAIRGGGEYGDQWHKAGITVNRQNAVDDFMAAGRWLIENGYTSREKLAANGGSASGALAGMIAVHDGGIFAATTVDYPIADLVRAPLYGNGALLVEEYGSLDDPAEARALIRQSPYHQVQTPGCRIPTLVMVGDSDKVALPFHGYKLAAAMQYSQNCDRPVLLYEMADTGHNYGSSADDIAESTSVQIGFLRTVLGF